MAPCPWTSQRQFGSERPIYVSDGTLSRSFHAGDGIEDIQTTEDGRIWASYFDEGVFGSTVLGQTGLACLETSGQVRFKFNELAARGTDIIDCYALNVCSDREVWLCYYTDFPLVQLLDGKIAGLWPELSVKGSHASAVSGREVLFAGGYENRNRLFLVDLDSSKVDQRIPVDADGNEIADFTAFGGGNRLWLQSGCAIFLVDFRIAAEPCRGREEAPGSLSGDTWGFGWLTCPLDGFSAFLMNSNWKESPTVAWPRSIWPQGHRRRKPVSGFPWRAMGAVVGSVRSIRPCPVAESEKESRLLSSSKRNEGGSQIAAPFKRTNECCRALPGIALRYHPGKTVLEGYPLGAAQK